MKKKSIFLLSIPILTILFVLFVLVVLIILFNKNPQKDNQANSCQTNSECIPDSCCHAKSCTLRSNAPNCNRVLCTMECAPDTLDCGQKTCACINNKCTAVANNE